MKSNSGVEPSVAIARNEGQQPAFWGVNARGDRLRTIHDNDCDYDSNKIIPIAELSKKTTRKDNLHQKMQGDKI